MCCGHLGELKITMLLLFVCLFVDLLTEAFLLFIGFFSSCFGWGGSAAKSNIYMSINTIHMAVRSHTKYDMMNQSHFILGR